MYDQGNYGLVLDLLVSPRTVAIYGIQSRELSSRGAWPGESRLGRYGGEAGESVRGKRGSVLQWPDPATRQYGNF